MIAGFDALALLIANLQTQTDDHDTRITDLENQPIPDSVDFIVVTGPVAGGTSTATCPPTHTLIGGGFATLGEDDYSPSGDRTFTSEQDSFDTWRVSVVDDSGIQSTVQAQAFCVKLQ